MDLSFDLVLNESINDSADKFNVKCTIGSIDSCPLCHTATMISPVFNDVRCVSNDTDISSQEYYLLHSFYVCPMCKCPYGAGYTTSRMEFGELKFGAAKYVFPRIVDNKIFPKEVAHISPDFVDTYHEAYQAEQYNLTKICGAGYRRAFEYLLKDYLINEYPNLKEQIIDAQMYDIINDKKHEYNMPIKIVEIAKRCAWLGNDHTHYRAKFTDNDLEDLKNAIDILLYWIMTEFKTAEILKIRKK